MKNHKQIAVDSNFVINNYKNYATERRQALFKVKPGSEQKVTAQTPAVNGNFSQAHAIDGNYAVLGTNTTDSYAGEADIYQKINGTWTYKQTLVATDRQADDKFGFSVAISGTTIVIGAKDDTSDQGSAYVFDLQSNGSWTQTAKLTASDAADDDSFGHRVSLSGDTALVGAYRDDDAGDRSGSAYIFERDEAGNWSQAAKLTASDGAATDFFGYAVSLAGDIAVIGAYNDDDKATNTGSAYIFERDNAGNWNQTAKLTAADAAANDRFGHGVSVYGNTALIGAYGDDNDGDAPYGSAYIFERDNAGNWRQTNKLIATDEPDGDYFGYSVSLSGDIALIGAYLDDDSASNSGAAYIFQKTADNVWRQRDKVKASDAGVNDYFGKTVSLSGTSIVVNASFDNPGNVTDAGSAYFYELEASDEFGEESPSFQPPFSLLTPGIHSLRRK